MNAPANTSTPDSAPKPRRLGRRLFIAAVAVLLVLFLLVALLPTLLSTNPGKNLILGYLNGTIDGSVQAKSLSLGWFSGQKVTGVDVNAPDGQVVVSNLSVDVPKVGLLGALTGIKDTGPITAHADSIILRQDAQGRLILPTANTSGGDKAKTSKPSTSSQTSGGRQISTDVVLTVGKITYERPGAEPYVIEDFKATTQLVDRQSAKLSVTGKVTRGQQVGSIDIHTDVTDLTDSQGKLQPDKAKVDVNIDIAGLPTEPIEALLGTGTQLADAVGPTLNLTAEGTGTLDDFTADAKLPPLTLKGSGDQLVKFGDGVLQVRPGAQPGDLKLTLSGQADVGTVSERVAVVANASNLFEPDKPIALALTAQKLPIALADAAAGQEGKLVETLGDLLDLTFNLTRQTDGTIVFSGGVSAPNLAGPFQGSYAQGKVIELSTPKPITATVTPRAYDLWFANAETGEPPARGFAAPATASIDVKALKLVMRDAAGVEDKGLFGVLLDPDNSSINASVSIPRASLVDRQTNAQVNAQNIQASVDGQNLWALEILSTLEFPAPPLAEGQRAGAAGPTTGAGSLTSRTTVRDLFNKQGAADLHAATIDSKTTLTQVPASLPDMLANQNGKLAALTGERINGEVTAKYQSGKEGLITANLDATNLQANAPLRITPDGVVELTQDITASLHVTDETSKSYLGDMHPLFADAVASEPDKPVRVVIKKDDVRVPLDGTFELTQLKMQGSINPGTLLMKRSGWIDQAVNGAYARLFNKQLRNRGPIDTYPAEFSPMAFKLNDGVLDTSELWLTSKDMGIGFQGSVDMNTNQIRQMSIGVLAATFYAIPGSDVRRVAPDYVFQLPIEGAIDAPKPRLDVLAFDVAAQYAKGSVDDDTAKLIGLGESLLRDLGRRQREKKTGQEVTPLTWHPSPAAERFADQFITPPADPSTAPQRGDQPASAQPTEEPQQGQERRSSPEEELARELIRGLFGGKDKKE